MSVAAVTKLPIRSGDGDAITAAPGLILGRRIDDVAVTRSRAGFYTDLLVTLTNGDALRISGELVSKDVPTVVGALEVSIANGPLDAAPASEEELGEALASADVSRALVSDAETGHPVHLLLGLADGRQIAIEARAVPAGGGRPLLRIATHLRGAVGD
jgi:hypothetical protein